MKAHNEAAFKKAVTNAVHDKINITSMWLIHMPSRAGYMVAVFLTNQYERCNRWLSHWWKAASDASLPHFLSDNGVCDVSLDSLTENGKFLNTLELTASPNQYCAAVNEAIMQQNETIKTLQEFYKTTNECDADLRAKMKINYPLEMNYSIAEFFLPPYRYVKRCDGAGVLFYPNVQGITNSMCGPAHTTPSAEMLITTGAYHAGMDAYSTYTAAAALHDALGLSGITQPRDAGAKHAAHIFVLRRWAVQAHGQSLELH